MTAFREEIDRLYKENSKASGVTAKFARALNIVINTSLKGGSGFLSELLQNAEDAGATEVVIRLVDDYLILEHNGTPFSMTDIKEVCDFGHDQDTSKAENNQKIGYKGVGFKAVFSVSNKVFVVTPEGIFSFDKAHFQDCNDKNNIPWQVCPIFVESSQLPEAVSKHQQHRTTIALKLKPNLTLDHEMRQLADTPETLLFLHNIQSLQLHANSFSAQLQVSKSARINDTHTVRFNCNSQDHSQWFVMNSVIDLDAKTLEILQDSNVDGTEYPDRLRRLKQTQIQFAARLDVNGKLIPGNGQFFAGLPTQVKSDVMPVLVNCTNLLLDASRKQLQENEWNQYLLTQIPQRLIGWMQTLGQLPEHRLDVLSLLPMPKMPVLPDSLQRSYELGIATASNTKCIPMIQGETTLQQAWQDDSGVMEAFPQFSTREYAHPQLQHKKRLTDYHQAATGTGRVLTFLEVSNQFENYFSSDRSPEFQQKFWRFVIAQTVKMKDTPNWLVNNLRVLGVDNKLHSIKRLVDTLYFPSAAMSVFETVLNFPLVHPALYQTDIEEFLGKLGIKTVSTTLIIQQFLIPALEKNTHPELNVAMLTFVLKNHSILSFTDHQKLAKAHVKTTRGEYLPVSQLYLSDSYDPEIKLEQSLPEARCFVAVDYLTVRDIPWKTHFLKLGAAENFNARCVTYTKENVEFALGGGSYAREFFQSMHKFDTGTAQAHTISMIELITDPRYRVAIWKSIEAHVKSGAVSYVKYYLQHAAVCLASDGNHYRSLSLLSSDVSPLVRSVLPHAALPITVQDYSFNRFLELRAKPTAAEWLLILDSLNRNKSRNVAQYNEVLKALYAIATQDGKGTEVKALTASWDGELIAGNGALQSVRKLHFCATSHFSMRPTANWLSQAIENPAKMAELFDIAKIDSWDYRHEPKNPKKDELTMARITDQRAISILVFIENMGREYNHQQVLEKTHSRLLSLRLIVADAISITDRSGKALQTADVVDHFDSELIYTHSAASPFVAPELAKSLQKKLGLSNQHMERILTMFISYDYADFTKYLEQFCGYNLQDIPSVKVDPPQEKVSDDSDKNRTVYIGIPLNRDTLFSRATSSGNKSEAAFAAQPSESAGSRQAEAAEPTGVRQAQAPESAGTRQAEVAGPSGVTEAKTSKSVDASSTGATQPAGIRQAEVAGPSGVTEAKTSESVGASSTGATQPAGIRLTKTTEPKSAPVKQAEEAKRTTLSPEEKAKRLLFVHVCKIGPEGIIFEGDTMSFEDITHKVKIFVQQEVEQYRHSGKAHEWGRGAVFQHLLRHYMSKFSPDMKVAEMQSLTHIRFISKDHHIVIDVQWFKYDDKTSKKAFDGDIHVTKRTFNKDGALVTEKLNKINVISNDAPKEGVAANIKLHWLKDKKEPCRLGGDSSDKQVQTSEVRVSM